MIGFEPRSSRARCVPANAFPPRSMAAELRISRISVFNAYEQLQSEGYLETIAGSGTCVAKTIPEETSAPVSVAKRAGTHLVAARPTWRAASKRASALLSPYPELWWQHRGAFRVNLPALEEFPINLWSKLVVRHIRTLSQRLMAYGDPMGYLPFRSAIAEYLGTFRGVRCDASQILITTGSQQALQISAQVLLESGDQVMVEDPGYPGARVAFMSSGLRIVGVPVDEDGLIVSEIRELSRPPSVVYVTPSHQYPLGMTMSAARRISLLNWARSTDSWIIEDDYDSEYRFDGRPIASLQGLDAHGRVIYIGTFSKVLFPALRLGYIVVPKNLVPYFIAVRDAADIFTSPLYQAVLGDFIREWVYEQFGVFGSGQTRTAVAGTLTASNGNVTAGEYDSNAGGSHVTHSGLSGTYTAPVTPTGRFTTTTSLSGIAAHRAAYLVSSTRFLEITSDTLGSTTSALIGDARLQGGSLTLNSNLAFYTSGVISGGGGGIIDFGRVTITGSSLTASVYEDEAGTWASPTPFTETCGFAIDSYGKVTLSGTNCQTNAPVIYLYGPNTGWMLGTGSSTSFGLMEPQSATTITSDIYFFGTQMTDHLSVETGTGTATLASAGATGTSDNTSITSPLQADQPLAETFTVSSDGSFSTSDHAGVVSGVIVSNSKVIVVDNQTSANPTILVFSTVP
jgi:DNA-binding transcriptional MocR family regulator